MAKEESGRQMEKNPFKILPDGTKMTGFVTAEENQLPRECGNCIFYSHDKCHHPAVEQDPEVLGEQGHPKPVGHHDCCNFYKSPSRVIIYAVRHGEDLDDDIIGGWNDPNLDTKGKRDAIEAAKFLKGKGIRKIYSSDLGRCEDTSKVIAKELGIPLNEIVFDFRLRTWDKGYLNGAPKTEENKKTLEYYKENSHLIIPKGESRDMFDDRNEEAFDYYVHRSLMEGVCILVMHNSNLKNLQEYAEAAEDYENPDSVLPGGIVRLSVKDNVLTADVVLKDKPKERS